MGRRLRLKIAARSSDLARLQAYRVGQRLAEADSGVDVQYSFRASLGDQNQHDPLWKMPEKGVFTEDFLSDLRSGEADLVVHSWKDLPTEARQGTTIAATLPRADSRDLFLMKRDRQTGGELRVLTSSPRRTYNLEAFFKTYLPSRPSEVRFENVRGNIATRVQKLLDQDVDGLVVAKAAIDRLLEAPEKEFSESRRVLIEAFEKCNFMVLPLSVNPTAAAQGALAIEIRSDRRDLLDLMKKIDCRSTFMAVERERAILASYGGGCHQKIGVSVLPREYGEVLSLRGLTDGGKALNQRDLSRSLNWEIPSDKIYPREDDSIAFFDREALPRSAWSKAESARSLWVARANAWPEGFTASKDAWVWCAGLRTWKKLAEQGVWVHGTADGLGEKESPQLEAIASATGHSLSWLKLTHDRSAGSTDACATYRLVPKKAAVGLRERTHFYWSSGTAFDRALELEPSIKTAFHASGPGLTHDHLVRALGRTTPIYLTPEAFRAAMGCGTEN